MHSTARVVPVCSRSAAGANLLEARAACEHELARAADTALASAVETEREATIRALQAATAALTARSGGMGQRRRTRRSSVGALMIAADHLERRGTMVADAEDVEEMRREGLLLAASNTGPKARRKKGGWAVEATRNVVVLVPELAALTIDDEWTLRDWFYGGWRRKMLYELLFRPGAYAFFLVGLLIPVWDPFAVAHMVGRPLSTRVSTTSVACLGNGLSVSNGSYAPARVTMGSGSSPWWKRAAGPRRASALRRLLCSNGHYSRVGYSASVRPSHGCCQRAGGSTCS